VSDQAHRFLFCCRGSSDDGLGHVIRTRAVIDRLPAGIEAELVVLGRDECAAPLLEGLAVPWTISTGDGTITERAAAFEPNVVVFDTIGLERAVFESVAAGRLTASLSPIFDHLDQVDLAFSRTRYDHNGIASVAPGRHYGLEYAIVRPECRRSDSVLFEKHLGESPMAIAISMGGADAPNRTLEVLDALHDMPVPATFWVLLGEGYAHSYRALVDCVKRNHRQEIILAKTNQSMWRIMRNCSLAILAGGVTTYEAAYAGLPSINLLEREGHGFLVRELVERGAALIGGTVDDRGHEGVLREVTRLERDRDAVLAMHRATTGLIDGRGAERVLEELVRSAERKRALNAGPSGRAAGLVTAEMHLGRPRRD
jgi:spore coat polysaccharide biosynthesis predicted glycosyltransferase SpsG